MTIISGTVEDDYLAAGDSGDELYGLGGADELEGGAGDDLLDGGNGDDILYARDGDDTLDGGEGDDLLYAEYGDDTLIGGAGQDEAILNGWATDYVVRRGPNGSFVIVDRTGLFGTKSLIGVEAISFGAPDYGAILADLAAEGTSGADFVQGGDGLDWLFGHDGDDVLCGAAGTNLIDGGDGDDTATYAGGSCDYRIFRNPEGLIQVDVVTGDGEDPMVLGSDVLIGVEHLHFETDLVTVDAGDVPDLGTSGADLVTGTARPDLLLGQEGDDELLGLAGDDILMGGDDADLLVGGSGVDSLTGNSGADVYAFCDGDSGLGAEADRILDFATGGDAIDLSAMDADLCASGDQAFVFVAGAAFSGLAGELRYGCDGNDTWLQGDVDGDCAADFEIVLSGQIILVQADFVL
jgi:Ca2+-binding RTX toxin-like protein